MNQYSKANNKYMGDQYDANLPSKYIQYLDVNNLYGWTMSKKLPTGKFAWMNDDELCVLNDSLSTELKS